MSSNRREASRTLLGMVALGALAGHARAQELSKKHYRIARATEFVLDLPADYVLELGGQSEVVIEAEPAVLAKVFVESRDGRAEIGVRGSFQTQKPIRVRVVTTAVEQLSMRTSGTLVASGLHGAVLKLVLEGSTQAELTALDVGTLTVNAGDAASARTEGRADSSHITADGSASYDGAALRCRTVTVNAQGAANVAVAAAQDLEVSAAGAAQVRYRGSPRLRKTVQDAAALERG